ncbi:MAG: hypothetical protein ACKPEY_18165 [Planctomycetota bacterium]
MNSRPDGSAGNAGRLKSGDFSYEAVAELARVQSIDGSAGNAGRLKSGDFSYEAVAESIRSQRGTTYWIAVDGYLGAQGIINLHLERALFAPQITPTKTFPGSTNFKLRSQQLQRG